MLSHVGIISMADQLFHIPFCWSLQPSKLSSSKWKQPSGTCVVIEGLPSIDWNGHPLTFPGLQHLLFYTCTSAWKQTLPVLMLTMLELSFIIYMNITWNCNSKNGLEKVLLWWYNVYRYPICMPWAVYLFHPSPNRV